MMPRMIRNAVHLTLAAGLLASPALAQDAQEEFEPVAAPPSWSFVIGAGTDNRSKDVSKSAGDPFAFAEAEWTSGAGQVYFAPAVETVKTGGARWEATAAAGFRPQLMGFDLDLNVAHKWRVDADPGQDSRAWELTADVMRSIGPLEGRIRVQYSPDGTGATESWTWTEARIGWEFRPGLEITTAVGRRQQENAIDYTGWNAGVTWDMTRDLALDVRWHDTDAPPSAGENYDGALVATISRYF